MNSTSAKKTGSTLENWGYLAIIATLLVMPIAFGVSSGIPSVFMKVVVGSILVLLSLILYALSRLQARSVSAPRSWLLLTAWLVPLAYVLAAVFGTGSTLSLAGERLSTDSGLFMIIGMLALTMVAVLANTHQRSLGIFLAFLVSAVVLSIAELAIFFARDAVTGIMAVPSLSLLGSLNDLAVFYSLVIVFVLLALIILPVTSTVRVVLWVSMAISSFFLAVVNLSVIWWVLSVFALGCLVYTITVRADTPGRGKNQKTFSVASLVVLLLCGFFLFGSDSITQAPAQWAEVGELDVRPSWTTTVNIGAQVFHEHALFGAGPGSFASLWARFMPEDINQTIFWKQDFRYGVGLIPTSIISTGLMGVIAWLLFLGTLLWYGLRRLILSRRDEQSNVTRFFRTASFVGALYLWIVACIQVPSVALVLLACILTGLFIASIQTQGNTGVKPLLIEFKDNPRLGFVLSLFLTVAILVSVGAFYTLGTRYVAEAAYQEAVRARSASDLDAAEGHLRVALRYHPLDIYYRVMSDIGLARMQALVAQDTAPEELVGALQDVMARTVGDAVKATEIDPNDYQNWLQLGAIYQSIAPLGIEGTIDSSEAAFDQVLELRPASPIARYAKAGLARMRGDNGAALSELNEALALRPQYTEARFLLAQIQLENQDVASAIKSVQEIAVLDPTNPVVYFQLGVLHYGSGNFEDAVRSLERAIALNSVYANARYFLGLSYWQQGRADEALQQFRVVYDTNKESTEVAGIIANLEQGLPPFGASAPAPLVGEQQTIPLPGADTDDAAGSATTTDIVTS